MIVAMDVLGHIIPSSGEDNQSAGEVRVYRKNDEKWLLEELLTPEVGQSEDEFGKVVAIGENQVVASAYNLKAGDPSSLNGLVYIFNYKSGQWHKPVVIKPPLNAKSDNFYYNRGFGNALHLVGDDLYIQAKHQGYSSNNSEQLNTFVACPYFDSFGVHLPLS